MVALKRAPSTATAYRTHAEIRNETRTPRMVTVCAPARPICLPNRPATIAPTSGAIGTTVSSAGERVVAMSCCSALERVELVDGDGRARSEQHDEDGEADGRLRGGDGEDEEDEDLAGHRIGARLRVEVVRERDEVQVDGEQHQLDRHQQHDQVLAIEEDADHRQREQDRADGEVVAERDRAERHRRSPTGLTASLGASRGTGSGFIVTMRMRSAFCALTCSDGSIRFESFLARKVSEIAAMIATSSSTAAICNGYR